MSRNFPDFLTAYEEYAKDDFLPIRFQTWAAISILAGALERKVWLPYTDKFTYYPNIYVILLAGPGVGKSASAQPAQKLLNKVKEKTQAINLISNQITQASFIEKLGQGRSFADPVKPNSTILQNAGYYFTSEAKNGLTNVFGDFIASLTDFYDCPDHWAKSTKKDGEFHLKNVCMNVLACTNFRDLNELVVNDRIGGGFASRMIYVITWKEQQEIKKILWPGDSNDSAYSEYVQALLEDLIEVSKMVGVMKMTEDTKAAWSEWFYDNRKRVQAFPEQIQEILVRMNPNVLKVSMILSASESDSRVIELRHFEKAVSLVEAAAKDVPRMIEEARANGPNAGGDSLSLTILKYARNGNNTDKDLRARLTAEGFKSYEFDAAFNSLLHLGKLVRGDAIAGRGILLRINEDANADL